MKTAALQIARRKGIVFSQLLAGPVTRFLAWFIDVVCISALLTFLGKTPDVCCRFSVPISRLRSIAWVTFAQHRLRHCLSMVLARPNHRKKLLRLRVVDAEGCVFNLTRSSRVTSFDSWTPARVFTWSGESFPSSILLAASRDIAANTIVIRNPRLIEPDLDQLLAGKYNSLRQCPHLAARLRQQVLPNRTALGRQALLRAMNLNLAPRRTVRRTRRHFRTRVEFPPEATDGITDEQYLRNVVDILYRSRTDTRSEKVRWVR